MNALKVAAVLLGTAAVISAAFIYSGRYSVAADEPHWPLTSRLIETLRERSIGARADGIEVPDLDQQPLIAEGANHYAAMCSGCHLAPGVEDTELRSGLYPRPSNLAKHAHQHGDAAADSARQFWIIKHGIKMTAMPAWGASHDDDAIWGLVAFLRKLRGMTPEAYAAYATSSGGHDHADEGHGAGAGPGDGHDRGAAATPGEPPAVAESLNNALAAGDTATVQTLLLPEVLIYESGAAETSAAEYTGHHMPADMAFLAQLQREQLQQAAGGDEQNAWVATRSRLSGQVNGKKVDLDSTETLILRKTENGWRVAHIHWSSAPNR